MYNHIYIYIYISYYIILTNKDPSGKGSTIGETCPCVVLDSTLHFLKVLVAS